jgi:hypothetical protein
MITTKLSGYFDLGYDPQRIQTGVEGLHGLGYSSPPTCEEEPTRQGCNNRPPTQEENLAKAGLRLSDCEAYATTGRLPAAMQHWPPAGVTVTAKQQESHARAVELFKLSCSTGAIVNSAGVADERLRFAGKTPMKPWMIIAGVVGIVGVIGVVALTK